MLGLRGTRLWTTWITCRWLAWSPYDMLSRAMCMPAAASYSIYAGVELAGPSVHTILVNSAIPVAGSS